MAPDPKIHELVKKGFFRGAADANGMRRDRPRSLKVLRVKSEAYLGDQLEARQKAKSLLRQGPHPDRDVRRLSAVSH